MKKWSGKVLEKSLIFTPWPFRPKGIAIISMRLSVCPHFSNLNITKDASLQGTAHMPKQWTYRGINAHQEIFHIGSFLGKKQLFWKKLCHGSILKKGLSQSLQTWWDDQIYLGLRITEKNSQFSDFCKNYGRFSKIGLYKIFVKLSILHQHDQFMYITGPIYGLLTLKKFFRLGHFWGKTAF